MTDINAESDVKSESFPVALPPSLSPEGESTLLKIHGSFTKSLDEINSRYCFKDSSIKKISISVIRNPENRKADDNPDLVTYDMTVALFRFRPLDVCIAAAIHPHLAEAVLDSLLSPGSTDPKPHRSLTEIDMGLLNIFFNKIAYALEKTWEEVFFISPELMKTGYIDKTGFSACNDRYFSAIVFNIGTEDAEFPFILLYPHTFIMSALTVLYQKALPGIGGIGMLHHRQEVPHENVTEIADPALHQPAAMHHLEFETGKKNMSTEKLSCLRAGSEIDLGEYTDSTGCVLGNHRILFDGAFVPGSRSYYNIKLGNRITGSTCPEEWFPEPGQVLSFRSGSLLMTEEELSRLQPGSVLQFRIMPEIPCKVYLNNRFLGLARISLEKSEWTVRVTMIDIAPCIHISGLYMSDNGDDRSIFSGNLPLLDRFRDEHILSFMQNRSALFSARFLVFLGSEKAERIFSALPAADRLRIRAMMNDKSLLTIESFRSLADALSDIVYQGKGRLLNLLNPPPSLLKILYHANPAVITGLSRRLDNREKGAGRKLTRKLFLYKFMKLTDKNLFGIFSRLGINTLAAIMGQTSSGIIKKRIHAITGRKLRRLLREKASAGKPGPVHDYTFAMRKLEYLVDKIWTEQTAGSYESDDFPGTGKEPGDEISIFDYFPPDSALVQGLMGKMNHYDDLYFALIREWNNAETREKILKGMSESRRNQLVKILNSFDRTYSTYSREMVQNAGKRLTPMAEELIFR